MSKGVTGGERIFDARNFHLAVARQQIVGAKSMPRPGYFESDEFIEIPGDWFRCVLGNR